MHQLRKAISEIKAIHTTSQQVDLLKTKIQHIKTTSQEEWATRYSPIVNELDHVLALGIPVPTLTVCGRGTQEIRFTKYLHYMLEPTNLHGLGDLLLTHCFNEILQANGVSLMRASSITIESEVYLGSYVENGITISTYCDVVITGEDFVLFIEQKTISGESFNQHSEIAQLKRYALCIEKNPRWKAKQQIKLFFTPNSTASLSSNEWMPYSQEQFVTKATALLQSEKLSSVAKGNLCRFLLDLIMGPYQKDEETIKQLVLSVQQLKRTYTYGEALAFIDIYQKNRSLIHILLGGKKGT